MPEILQNIKAENRLDKIRIVSENDDVIGGQPSPEGSEENDNNAIFDLACTAKKLQEDIKKVDEKPKVKVLDSFGDSTEDAGSQRTINKIKTVAEAAQKKADQIPDPIADNFVVGNTITAYVLRTIAEVKALLGVPEATKLYSGTGQATDGSMTQNAVTKQLILGEFENFTGSRIQGAIYHNGTDKVKEVWIAFTFKNQSTVYLSVGNGNFQVSQIIEQNVNAHSHVFMRIPPFTNYSFYLVKHNTNAALEIQQWFER